MTEAKGFGAPPLNPPPRRPRPQGRWHSDCLVETKAKHTDEDDNIFLVCKKQCGELFTALTDNTFKSLLARNNKGDVHVAPATATTSCCLDTDHEIDAELRRCLADFGLEIPAEWAGRNVLAQLGPAAIRELAAPYWGIMDGRRCIFRSEALIGALVEAIFQAVGSKKKPATEKQKAHFLEILAPYITRHRRHHIGYDLAASLREEIAYKTGFTLPGGHTPTPKATTTPDPTPLPSSKKFGMDQEEVQRRQALLRDRERANDCDAYSDIIAKAVITDEPLSLTMKRIRAINGDSSRKIDLRDEVKEAKRNYKHPQLALRITT